MPTNHTSIEGMKLGRREAMEAMGTSLKKHTQDCRQTLPGHNILNSIRIFPCCNPFFWEESLRNIDSIHGDLIFQGWWTSIYLLLTCAQHGTTLWTHSQIRGFVKQWVPLMKHDKCWYWPWLRVPNFQKHISLTIENVETIMSSNSHGHTYINGFFNFWATVNHHFLIPQKLGLFWNRLPKKSMGYHGAWWHISSVISPWYHPKIPW